MQSKIGSSDGLRFLYLLFACERHGCEVLPERFQRLHSTKQRGEDGGIGEENVSGTLSIGRHPNTRVELCVPGGGKRMRSVKINRLARKHVD